MALLDQIQNVRDLALLPLSLFGTDLSVGQLFMALLLAFWWWWDRDRRRAMALIFRYTAVGLGLLFEGSVRPGEVLMMDGDPCEVRSLGLRATVLWRDRDNAELVIGLLEGAAVGIAGVLRDPPPRAFLVDYGESAINYSLRYWIDNPMRNLSVRDAVGRSIWAAFASQGIEIPFPQRVVHQPCRAPAPSS